MNEEARNKLKPRLPSVPAEAGWSSVLYNWRLVNTGKAFVNEMVKVRVKQITDGLSKSLMLFEDAGRPSKFSGSTQVAGTATGGASWADLEVWWVVHGHLMCGDLAAINCTNDNEIYSFHPGGANFTMGDGAVRFIQADIDPATFVALHTRAGQDVVGGDF